MIHNPSKADIEFKWKANSHWKELAELIVDADLAAFKKRLIQNYRSRRCR